jgi:hypothetical protein
MERRRAARLAARYRVQYRPGQADAFGTIVSISRSGALLATGASAPLPSVGEALSLLVAAPEPTVELEARVVSVGVASFAIEFVGEPVELLELLSGLPEA